MGTKLSKIRHIILSATKGPHWARKEHTYTRRRKRTRTGRKMKEENTKRTTRTQTRTAPEDDTILGVSEHLNNMRIRQTAACAARMQNCHSQAERQARYQLQQFNREPAVWNPNLRDKPAQAASNASAQPHMSTPIISLNGRRTHLHVSAIPSTCTTRTNHDLTLL